MRLRLVCEHLPEEEGTASGRLLRAVGDGLVAEGHDVSAVCWTDRSPREDLPGWAQWRPLTRHAGLTDHLTALWRPRWASAALELPDEDDSVSVAEDPLSFAAIAHHRRTAVVVHYSNRLDSRSLGAGVRPAYWQGHRADRRAVRRAGVPLSYSRRVAERLGGGAHWVPAAVHVPEQALTLPAQPTAVLLAGWDWAPNLAALDSLLAEWPEVRRRVPGAELVLAGRGVPTVGALPGVRVLGEVPTARDAFAAGSVLAFPCPPSSGPKTKVLEAMAAGLPVVTTPAGVEGLATDAAAAAAVVPLRGFADRLAEVLGDEPLRARMADRARAAVIDHHSPRVAAAALVHALG